jgi:uncharacterized RDD family membrane protein YckC
VSHAARRSGGRTFSGPEARPAAARVHRDTHVAEGTVSYEGLVTRAIAFAIDAALINAGAIIVAAAVALLLSVLSVPDWLGTVLLGLGASLFLVWSIGYFVVFWSTTGQTPGDRLMRIRVCRADDGRTLSARRSLLRLVYLTLAAIPLLAGFLPILVDDRRRGLHDMLAGTVVVSVPEQELTRRAHPA